MGAKKAGELAGSVVSYLSGDGANPMPQGARGRAGPLEKKFVAGAMREISLQDRANERKVAPSVADTLMAVIRLVSDNREMIQLIQGGKVSTMSEVAAAMGRELSNVSRTLSRMAAYGLIRFDDGGVDARSKKPVWLMDKLPGGEGLDWVQAYCLSMALNEVPGYLNAVEFASLVAAVRCAAESVADGVGKSAWALPPS